MLAALGLPGAPSAADDASALLGNWRVPPYEQQRMRMSDQCQRSADTDVQNVAESEVEVFSCDDPKFAAEKARGGILNTKFDELLRQAKENPDLTPPKRDIDLD